MTQQTVYAANHSVKLVQNFSEINIWRLFSAKYSYLTQTGFLVQNKKGVICLTREAAQEGNPFLIQISLMQRKDPVFIESMLDCLHQICDQYEAQYLKSPHTGTFSMTTQTIGCLFNFYCDSSEVIDILKFLQRLSRSIKQIT